MKTRTLQTLAAVSCLAATLGVAHAADAPETKTTSPQPAAVSPSREAELGDKLRLNFRGVGLDMVLEYLSEAAGFIIVKETEVKGKVDVWSNQPLTRDEAVDLLNSILNKNDYAAIRNGRTLTIVSRDEAKKRDIPVKRGGEAKDIPKSDEMVTQILPVHYANATQLQNNLRPLIGTYAEMNVNESANSLIVTATQADIKRLAEIVNALDDSISSTSSLRVFPIKYADAKELATAVKELFAPQQQQQGNQQGNRGGFGGGNFNPFAGGGFGGGAAAGGAAAAGAAGAAGGRGGAGGGSRSGASSPRVVAVAEERSNSLIVAAPEEVLNLIAETIQKLDVPVADITELRVFPLRNADPQEMADLLASLFPDESRSSSNNQQQQQFRFGGPFGGGGGNNRNNAAASTSERLKKQGRVLAVPDARTSSIIVSAASELMPQIESMVAQLDSSKARRQRVFVYSLENADPQQVEQMLQGMFQRSTTTANRNNANQSSALSTRIQSNNQSISSGQQNNTGFGGGNGGGGNFGGGGGGGFR